MSDMNKPDIQKLIAARLEEFGLTRLSRMFSVEHNVPRGTHKAAAAESGTGDMTKAVYDTDDNGQVGAADHADTAGDADTVDGEHADAFADAAHAHAFLDLTDVDEPAYTGHAGEMVKVNAVEDGLDFGACEGGLSGYGYDGTIGIADIQGVGGTRISTHLSADSLAHVSHFHLPLGTGDNESNSPWAICSDGTYYYIADNQNHRIKKHRISDGLFIWAVGTLGTGTDQFNTPRGMCTDGTYLYITDEANNRIKKHRCSDGSFVSLATVAAVVLDPPNPPDSHNFNSPRAICTDGTYLYIAQTSGATCRLVVLTVDLVPVIQIHDDGHIDSATLLGICVLGNYLYLVNANWSDGIAYFSLYKYTKAALAFVSGYGTTGHGDDEFWGPYGICTDGTYFYITNTGDVEIKKLRVSDFGFVSQIGTHGTGDNEFQMPIGICIGGNSSVMPGFNADMVDGYHHDQGLLTTDAPAFDEVKLTPKASSTGAEGTMFYCSGDDHVYVGTE